MKADAPVLALRPLWRRVLNLLGRGVVSRVDEGGELQRVQARLLAREVRDGVDVLGHYGLASWPDPGAEALVVFLGGNRDGGVAVSVEDRRYRPRDLEAGEVRLYSKAGNCVRILADGSIEVRGQAGIRVVGDVSVQGDLEVTGDVAASGDVSDGWAGPGGRSLAEFRTHYNLHVHPETGSGPTGPPTVTL